MLREHLNQMKILNHLESISSSLFGETSGKLLAGAGLRPVEYRHPPLGALHLGDEPLVAAGSGRSRRDGGGLNYVHTTYEPTEIF